MLPFHRLQVRGPYPEDKGCRQVDASGDTKRTCDAMRCGGKVKHTKDDEVDDGFAVCREFDENDDDGRSRQRG